jgi:hypothetical protein
VRPKLGVGARSVIAPARRRLFSRRSPMAKISRARLLEALYYAQRHIATGAGHIEKQRAFVERLEAFGHGNSTTAATARALLVTMEQAQLGHIADRKRIGRLLAR